MQFHLFRRDWRIDLTRYKFWVKTPRSLEEAVSYTLNIIPGWALERMAISNLNNYKVTLRWLSDSDDDESAPFFISIHHKCIRLEDEIVYFSQYMKSSPAISLDNVIWNNLFIFYCQHNIPHPQGIALI